MNDWIQKIGFVAAVALPLWNIPLILRIVQRKSSDDISLSWALGVWVCIVLMFPANLLSPDPIMVAFGVSNILFFSAVLVTVLRYRSKKPRGPHSPPKTP